MKGDFMNKTRISKGISIGVRIAALISIVLFFIPSMCVSCGDAEIEFSCFDAAIGDYDDNKDASNQEEVSNEVESAPWLFLIPVLAILIAFYATRFHILSICCALGNIITMFVFKAVVENWTEENFGGYAKVETMGPFTFQIVICVLIIITLAFDMFFLWNYNQENCNSMKNERFCKKCAIWLDPFVEFCPFCGSSVKPEAFDTGETSGETSEGDVDTEEKVILIDMSALSSDDEK